VDGEVEYLSNSLLHYPYKNFSDYMLKWSRYVDLIRDELRSVILNKSVLVKLIIGFNYVLLKPIWWFLVTYIRHKGFMDSWQGFVFSFISSLRFPTAFIRFVKNSS
jgi:hypothetical protein